MEERKELRGELCRICGWDNAMFDYTIDTATNRVTYHLDAVIGGKAQSATFQDYATASAAFDALDRQIKARREHFGATPVLQATLAFKDGSHRRVVISKPDDTASAPYIGEAFYKALQKQGITGTLEDWEIFVLDRRKRVVAKIPIANSAKI